MKLTRYLSILLLVVASLTLSSCAVQPPRRPGPPPMHEPGRPHRPPRPHRKKAPKPPKPPKRHRGAPGRETPPPPPPHDAEVPPHLAFR